MLCGKYRDELLDEVIVNDMIMVIAEEIKKTEYQRATACRRCDAFQS